MTLSDRTSFSHSLEAALAASEPVQRVNDLLRRVLALEPVPWESDEQRLVRGVAERIDTASGDANRLVVLARDVEHLLDQASSNDSVEILLELIAERQRVMIVMRKYAEGTISRTSLLSFVGEQRWPDSVRRRVAELSADDLANVMKALEESDIVQLEKILIA